MKVTIIETRRQTMSATQKEWFIADRFRCVYGVDLPALNGGAAVVHVHVPMSCGQLVSLLFTPDSEADRIPGAYTDGPLGSFAGEGDSVVMSFIAAIDREVRERRYEQEVVNAPL